MENEAIGTAFGAVQVNVCISNHSLSLNLWQAIIIVKQIGWVLFANSGAGVNERAVLFRSPSHSWVLYRIRIREHF
jgi:hypothetical protein